MLSEPKIEERFFIHKDQILLFHLLKNNEEENEEEENEEENEEEENEEDIIIDIREKEKIEEIIEKDDIESFRLISSENNFDFNRKIKKENKLFNYTEIPIILYCIEMNAIKCFKYAGAIGNIQIMKMIEDQEIPINGNLIKGASKFHKNHIIHWTEKEHNSLLKEGMKESIQYHNYEVFDILAQKFGINSLTFRNKTPLHYAAKFNSKEIVEILISKGADINAKDIIYQIMILLFLIKII